MSYHPKEIDTLEKYLVDPDGNPILIYNVPVLAAVPKVTLLEVAVLLPKTIAGSPSFVGDPDPGYDELQSIQPEVPEDPSTLAYISTPLVSVPLNPLLPLIVRVNAEIAASDVECS